jgi:hypothetical protein
MHPIEVHMPAAMAVTNLELAEAFEEVDQVNGAPTLQTNLGPRQPPCENLR